MTPLADLSGLPSWLDLHNGAVIAAATVVLVLVTILYVTLVGFQLSELRREREEASRPHLEAELSGVVPAPAPLPVATPAAMVALTFRVVNNSRVAAYHSLVCAVDANGNWFKAGPFGIGPGEDEEPVRADSQTGPPPPADILGGQPPRRVVLCQNQFGRRFRFREDAVAGDRWTGRRWWQVWRRTPAWVRWYESQLRAHFSRGKGYAQGYGLPADRNL